MRGQGNDLFTLLQKTVFFLIPTSGQRTRWIIKHKHLFKHVGEKIFFQPRKLPADPERIAFGDNVKISSEVMFINHDIASYMLNDMYKTNHFEVYEDDIEIGNNVMIGSKVIILPGAKIGDNSVIGAGAIVSGELDGNGVYVGIPARKIKSFDVFVEERNKDE